MATIPSTPRTNSFTLATESAGPFLVGFRLLDADGLTVYVNGVAVTNYTLSANFVDGYDDSATITFLTALPAATEVQIDGSNPAERADDYVNGDPLLTAKMNIELARIWASVAEIGQGVRRAVRGLSEIDPLPDAVATDLSDLGGAVATAEAAAAAAAVSAAEALAKENSMLRWRGNWVTATAYSLSDIVYNSGSAYICIIAHTSGTFGTDLGALRWTLFAQQGAAGPGTGDMLKTENLSGLANVATARGNLGLGAMAIKANVAFTDLDAAAVITSGEGLFANDNDTSLPASASVIDALGALLIVVDEKASGTNGGGFTSGAWRTRTLNTTRVNAISGASLASNQVTLPAGTYLVDISAPALRVNSHQARLQNITAGTTLLWGSSEISEQGGAIVQSRSFIRGTITLGGSTVIEVQHAALTTFGGVGLGQAMGNAGAQEVYTIATFQRIG